jgi:hypothetical protein
MFEHSGVPEVLFVVHTELVFPTRMQEIFPVLGSFLRTDQPRIVADDIVIVLQRHPEVLGILVGRRISGRFRGGVRL